MDDETLDRFRFSLMRLQLWADIHRNEDLEKAMHIKYVAQVLEKVVFGSLVMEQARTFRRLNFALFHNPFIGEDCVV